MINFIKVIAVQKKTMAVLVFSPSAQTLICLLLSSADTSMATAIGLILYLLTSPGERSFIRLIRGTLPDYPACCAAPCVRYSVNRGN